MGWIWCLPLEGVWIEIEDGDNWWVVGGVLSHDR